MACSTPVLTYKTGGSPESAEAYGGIVVERGDISAVINAIERYRKENRDKPELNVDAEAFDKQTAVKDYQKIIGGGGTGLLNSRSAL